MSRAGTRSGLADASRLLPDSTDWCGMWRALGAAQCDEALRADLIARHEEAARHYHTTQHLAELFAWWPVLAPEAQRPAEVEAAVWFHDAVYRPARGDNEQRSASLARTAMERAGVASDAADRIEAMILATRHEVLPATTDERIVVDLDLSILGAPSERFDEYERQVRAEYAFVPEVLFRRNRSQVLGRFLARQRIFQTDALHDRLEAAARANLMRSPYAPS